MSMFAQPRHQGRRGGKSRLGHLKLSVREESSALVIIIHEARGLKRKDGAPSDTYVKLYLRPDPRKLSKEKTRRVKEKDPVFNQRFSYVLGDEDLCKILSVSVWNRDWTGRSEVIGCMSFAVSDLLGPGKEVHGWYELLDIHKGAIENVMVPDTLSRMGSQGSLNSMSSYSILGPKNYAVVLMKGPRGYGFSVSTETSPVMITSVQEGLTAHQQDLRAGDLIIEVENTDVTRANSDMIVNMIKKCKESVQLIVQRNPAYSSGGGAAAAAATTSQPFLSQSYTDLSNGGLTSRRGDRRLQDSRRYSTGAMTQPPDFQSSHWSNPVDDRIRMVSTSRERVNMSRSGERLPEVPEEGRSQTSNLNIPLPTARPMLASIEQTTPTSLIGRKISQPSSQRSEGIEQSASQRHLSSSQPGGLNTSFAPTLAKHVKQLSGDLGAVKKLSLGSPTGEEQDALFGLAMQSVTQSKMHPTNHQQTISYQPRSLYSSKLSTSSYGSYGSSDSAYATGLSSRSLNPDERQSPSAASSPQRLSPERGLNRSQSGPYSGTASPDQIDGPVEELEWESLGRLEQKRQRAINSLLKCEREFFDELQNGITTYMTPLGQGVLSEDSHRTIFMNISKMFELSRFTCTQLEARAVPYCSPSSSVPLHVDCVADVYHSKVQTLMHVYSGYLRNADNAHKEIAISFTNADFKRIVQEPGRKGQNLSTIYNFVDGGKEYLCKMSRLLLAINNLTPPTHPDHSHLYLTTLIKGLMEILPNSCRDLVKAWNSQLEVMEGLRLRIAFNNNVVPFPVSVPGRFLVHDGEVILLEKKKKRKVSLWLFSDILLITKRTGRILGTLEPPIELNQLLVQDLNCSVVEEFHTSTVDGSINRQFRAPTVQAKVDWMQKLKERATGHLIMKGKGGAKRSSRVTQQQLNQPGSGRFKPTMEEQEQLLEILQLPSVLTQPADDMNSRAAVHHRSASQSHRHHMPRFLRWKKSHNTHSHLSQDSSERPSRRPRPQSLVATGTQDFLMDLE